MKFASYYSRGLRIGAVKGSHIWDLRRVFSLYMLEVENDPQADEMAKSLVPSDMSRFIQLNHGNLAALEAAVERSAQDDGRLAWFEGEDMVFNLDDIRVFSPILRPTKIVNVGNSYRDHILHLAEKRGIPEDEIEFPPEVKISFVKTSSAVISAGDPVRYPKGSTKWDFEGEFSIVIGRKCSHVSIEDADSYIFGYTVLNDASNRDVPPVLGGLTSPKGKSADTLAPLGPWIVTPDGLGKDPNDLSVKVWVNGEIRQDSNTSQLLWPVQEIVAVASSFMTLFPGDVIATGSPAGTALETGRYLSEGDVVRIEIEGVGALENPVGPPV